MVKKYVKKPVVIEAVQFTADNIDEVLEFCKAARVWVVDAEPGLEVETLEGTMTARIGDFIIRGVKGEFYPCKPDVFEQTYEVVE